MPENPQDVTFEILVETKRSETNAIKLQQAVQRLTQKVSEGRLTASQADAIYARYAKTLGVAKQQADQTKIAINQMSKATRAAAGKNSMGFLIQQVGFLASDARYGLLGMANNLSLIVSLLPGVIADSKATGGVFKSLGRTLLGPFGLILAFQVIITLLPEIIKWFNQWRNGLTKTQQLMKDATLSVAKKTAQLDIYQSVLNKANAGERSREYILKQLKKQRIIHQDLDANNIEDLKEINKLIDAHRKSIILKAKAQALESRLQEKLAQKERGRFLSFIDYIIVAGEAVKQLILNFTPGGLILKRWGDSIRSFFVSIGNGIYNVFREAYEGLQWILEKVGIDLPDIAKTLGEAFNIVQDEVVDYAEDAFQPVKDLIERLKKEGLDELDKETQELLDSLTAMYAKLDELETNSAQNSKRTKQQRINDLQQTLGAITSFLNNAAQLDNKNKALARSAIIASGAASILGAWESWLVKDPTFIPAPIKTAGAIATTASVIAATASSLKSLNSGSLSSGGNQSAPPNLNVIGATGTNQLQQAIQGVGSNIKDQKVNLITSELEEKENDTRVTLEQSTFG